MRRVSSSREPAPLEDRLSARRDELEQAILARIAAISDPAVAPDPAYLTGLRAALTAALDYGLSAILAPGREPEPVPVQLLGQARLAARNGVGLEAVLRRYAAGHSLLADSLLDEASAAGIGTAELKSALHALAERYDRVVVAVSGEYAREAEADPHSPERRRHTLLRRLLGGERLDTSELGYELDSHHLAIVASGAAAAQGLADLGERLDRRLLLAEPDEQSAWAWLGGRRAFECSELDLIASHTWPEGVALACGAPAQGLAGWRLSHRQAAAALPIAQRGPAGLVHYGDVALLASALQDDLLATSLRHEYLDPLEAERDGGAAARKTLRAYFAAAGNVSSAAAALGVNRATVRSRLLAIEERFGRPLAGTSAEIEVALRLDRLEARSSTRSERPLGRRS
jgi:hypothetical protein